ncbi:LLM class flavin-dependent oxidoreductase [Streptomyces sp. NPDC001262]|uniref:LLM class flavin-dependent oxidoreductase n=1 Tax=unclassified Streptomyces TaxID=2593676 RepID=UPI0036B1E024
MEISVGLPTTVPGVNGPALVEFARRADRLGFAGLGAVDRLVYDNYESLVALAAAAAVTERIRLATTVLLAGYRGSPALLAKQLATLDHLSGGRLVVGLAAGDREDDFAAAGAPFRSRGRLLDAAVEEMRAAWAAGSVGPRPPRGLPPLLFGGHSAAAMRRAARLGEGWIAGGGSATGYAELVARARAVWDEHGRTGRLRVVSLCYVSLGPGGAAAAGDYLRRYYSWIGPKAEQLASQVVADGGRLREVVAGYAEAGCDELLLFPCVADPCQADLIAGAVMR